MAAYEGPARVLVGYDGSRDADAALAHAVAEVRRRGAELAIVCAVDDIVLNSAWGVVFDPQEIKRDAARMLDGVTAELVAQGIPAASIRAEVVLGAPAPTLVRLSEWASLVVVGRCSGSSARAFVGSTAVGVAGAAHCPVVVLSADDQPPAQPHGRIGVGVNTAVHSERPSLVWAFGEAQRLGAGLSVISVSKAAQNRWFGSADADDQHSGAVAAVRERVGSLVEPARRGFEDVQVDIEVSYGSPLDALVAASESLDLLVVEVQPTLRTFAVSAVDRGVMMYARCPVALFRANVGHV